MMVGKIWQRYFLKEFLKCFILIIVSFYGLYVLIDYASHSSGRQYHHSDFALADFFLHYFYEFAQRADVMIPFALLIAAIRTLTKLNGNNELIALLAGGVKTKSLLRPFLFVGLFFVAATYLNLQFVLPHALKETRHLNDTYSIQKNKKKGRLSVRNVVLRDQSVLLYQDYNSSKNEFYDAYWVISFDEIYRIKHLAPGEKVPEGRFIDHLVRNKDGEMEKIASFEHRAFPEMRFNRKVLLDSLIPPEENSLSTLWSKYPAGSESLSEKESEITATFFQKMIVPWFCLLAIIGPAPFCIRYARYFPTFFLYALGIFGLVAYSIVLDASTVLVGRQVLDPLWAMGLPFAVVFLTCLWNYVRIK